MSPDNVELRDVVRGLRNGRAIGTTSIRAETINGWLRGVEREEKEDEGNTGAGDTWRTLLKLVKAIWENGVCASANAVDYNCPAPKMGRRL